MYGRMLTTPRIYYISISIIILLEIVLYTQVNREENVAEMAKAIMPPDHLIYACCVPLNISLQTNLFFLKTHKTGGTTVENIIYRLAVKYPLTIMRPIYTTYYRPFSTKSLGPKSITPDNKYNILASHMRYTSKLRLYQYPNTPMITLLRHPAKLFYSVYTYFHMENTTGMTFEEFLKAPVKPTNLRVKHSSIAYRGYNQMSVDLGFDLGEANNETAVQEFIRKIDEEFDFIMITEYMEASLILLANLMGWPLEYIVHLKLNARPDTLKEYTLTEQDELTLMELNKIDTLLYHHFIEKFRKCMRQYGFDRMNEQVFRLRKMNEEFRERCVAAENTQGMYKSVNYELRNASDLECAFAIDDRIHKPSTLRWYQKNSQSEDLPLKL